MTPWDGGIRFESDGQGDRNGRWLVGSKDGHDADDVAGCVRADDTGGSGRRRPLSRRGELSQVRIVAIIPSAVMVMSLAAGRTGGIVDEAFMYRPGILR